MGRMPQHIYRQENSYAKHSCDYLPGCVAHDSSAASLLVSHVRRAGIIQWHAANDGVCRRVKNAQGKIHARLLTFAPATPISCTSCLCLPRGVVVPGRRLSCFHGRARRCSLPARRVNQRRRALYPRAYALVGMSCLSLCVLSCRVKRRTERRVKM